MSQQRTTLLAWALFALIIREGFVLRPNDETDLDTLAADLLAAVDEALQPEHISL